MMTSALATDRSSPDADWLPLDQAAARMDCSLRSARRLASIVFARGLSRLVPSPTGTGKPAWQLHRRARPSLSAAPGGASEDIRESLLAALPRHHVERAFLKLRWLLEWRKQLASPRIAGRTDADLAARIVAQAREQEGKTFKISVSSLKLWWRQYNRTGSDGCILGVRGLIDQYAMLDRFEHRPAGRSPQAVDHFYQLFRTTQRMTVTYCHGVVLREARRAGWSWPSSARSTSQWLDRYDDRAFTHLCRWGWKDFAHRFMPYSEQDWRLVEPGAFYVCDHTQVDFWVAYKATQIRPWLTAVQDCRSRRIVGWHLGPAPHQEAILCALRMAFRQAVPQVCRIDNGKDFTSRTIVGLTKIEIRQLRAIHGPQWKEIVRKDRNLLTCDDPRWQGIVGELHIKLIFALKYSPWSKGTLERWFGTFEDQCARSFASYCGNSPITRPECLQQIREGRTGQHRKGLELIDLAGVPTLQEARERIAEYMTIYEAVAHRGRGLEGRTPADVWAAAAALRKVDETALDFLISIRGAYKVWANGVSLVIGGQTLSYGARSAALTPYKGREVLVAVDPEYPARCLAFDVDSRKLIARLEPNEPLHPDLRTDDLREAIAERQGARKRYRRAAREARAATLSAAQLANRDLAARAHALRATGTDDVRANVIPVPTGFEGASISSRSAAEAPSFGEYRDVDLSSIDLSPANEEEPSDPYADVDISEIRLARSVEEEDV